MRSNIHLKANRRAFLWSQLVLCIRVTLQFFSFNYCLCMQMRMRIMRTVYFYFLNLCDIALLYLRYLFFVYFKFFACPFYSSAIRCDYVLEPVLHISLILFSLIQQHQYSIVTHLFQILVLHFMLLFLFIHTYFLSLSLDFLQWLINSDCDQTNHKMFENICSLVGQ